MNRLERAIDEVKALASKYGVDLYVVHTDCNGDGDRVRVALDPRIDGRDWIRISDSNPLDGVKFPFRVAFCYADEGGLWRFSCLSEHVGCADEGDLVYVDGFDRGTAEAALVWLGAERKAKDVKPVPLPRNDQESP